MGATKYEVYTQEAIEIAELFKAFAHPARIMVILELLEAESTSITLSTLLEEIKLSQSSLSKHVDKLKVNGVLTTRIERVGSKCYQVLGINESVMNDFRKITSKILNMSDKKNCSSFKGYSKQTLNPILNRWLDSNIT